MKNSNEPYQPKRSFEGVWVPGQIWVTKQLSWMEKLVLTEIKSLDDYKQCFATNSYLADFFQLSKTTISGILQSLKKKDFIQMDYYSKPGSKAISKRIIIINEKKMKDLDEEFTQYLIQQKHQTPKLEKYEIPDTPTESRIPPSESRIPCTENFTGSNKGLINKSNKGLSKDNPRGKNFSSDECFENLSSEKKNDMDSELLKIFKDLNQIGKFNHRIDPNKPTKVLKRSLNLMNELRTGNFWQGFRVDNLDKNWMRSQKLKKSDISHDPMTYKELHRVLKKSCRRWAKSKNPGYFYSTRKWAQTVSFPDFLFNPNSNKSLFLLMNNKVPQTIETQVNHDAAKSIKAKLPDSVKSSAQNLYNKYRKRFNSSEMYTFWKGIEELNDYVKFNKKELVEFNNSQYNCFVGRFNTTSGIINQFGEFLGNWGDWGPGVLSPNNGMWEKFKLWAKDKFNVYLVVTPGMLKKIRKKKAPEEKLDYEVQLNSEEVELFQELKIKIQMENMDLHFLDIEEKAFKEVLELRNKQVV